jgi:hypothetical protein
MTDEEKKEIIDGFIKLSAQHAFAIFELCGLKTHIESRVIDAKTNQEYEYSFKINGFTSNNDSKKEEYIVKIKELQGDGDIEINHQQADKLLCELLIKLGHKDVVDEYNKIDKWYA